MKKKIVLLTTTVLIVFSCEQEDLCNDGYKPHKQNGQTICIPDYLQGKVLDPKDGNTYYHQKYGIITNNNGIWKNENGLTIQNLNK